MSSPRCYLDLLDELALKAGGRSQVGAEKCKTNGTASALDFLSSLVAFRNSVRLSSMKPHRQSCLMLRNRKFRFAPAYVGEHDGRSAPKLLRNRQQKQSE